LIGCGGLVKWYTTPIQTTQHQTMGQYHSTQDFTDIHTGFGLSTTQQAPPTTQDPGFISRIANLGTGIWGYIASFTVKNPDGTTSVTHVNWNILADGLGGPSGFVTPSVLPTTKEFQDSVLTLTKSRKELNGYEKQENCKELMEKWLEAHPEFTEYQITLEKLLQWENSEFSEAQWEAFYACESLDEMEKFISKVGYPGRGPVMVKKMELLEPDILTIQEMDKYKYFCDELLGYSSSVGDSPYQRVGFSSVGKSRGTKFMVSSTDDYEAYLAKKTHAFVPKLNSTCYSLNPAKKVVSSEEEGSPGEEMPTMDPDEPDDDGSCIFWKTDRFDCLEIDYHLLQSDYENKKGIFKATGVVYAKLQDKKDGTIAHVFSTHLTSGNKEQEEAERVKEIQRVNDFIKDKTCGSDHSQTETDCLADGHYIILGMDGNSYQGFSVGDFDETCNMYSVLQESGLTNYHPLQEDDDDHITWSVNKIRGPISDQVRKIGDYQLDRIDYSATSGNLSQIHNPDQERLELMARSPRYAPTTTDASKKEIYGKMLPNMFNPSDHLPVVVSYKLD
jgi:hypothetical protein